MRKDFAVAVVITGLFAITTHAQPPAPAPKTAPTPAAAAAPQTLFRTVNLAGKPQIELTGEIFDIEVANRPLVFRLSKTRQGTQDGQVLAQTTYETPEGEKVAIERLFYQGTKFLRYELDYYWIKESFAIDVEEWQIKYQQLRWGSEVLKSQEGLKHNTVAGGHIVSFVTTHWAELKGNQQVDFNFAIPDRRETFGFKLNRWDNPEVPAGQMGVKMMPANFFVALFVPALKFFGDPQTGKVSRVLGRTFLHKRTPEGLKTLQGDMILKYPESNGNPKVVAASSTAH